MRKKLIVVILAGAAACSPAVKTTRRDVGLAKGQSINVVDRAGAPLLVIEGDAWKWYGKAEDVVGALIAHVRAVSEQAQAQAAALEAAKKIPAAPAKAKK